MSTKADKFAELLDRIPLAWDPPQPMEGVSLLEQGLLCVLSRHLSRPQAEKTLRALSAAYPDLNELRITQIQELQPLIATRNEPLQRQVASAAKEYLQEIFQQNHGYDIEFLRTDLNEASKFIQQLPFLGASAAHYLLWVATGGELPVSTQVVRVLDRLGVMKRTSSPRKAQSALETLVPAPRRMDFGLRIGAVAERWCDIKRPICWECVLVETCPHGKKVLREWKQQQARLEVQRRRDEERRVREEEKARKRAEIEARKEAKELERKRAREERERVRLEARHARERQRVEAEQKRVQAKAALEEKRKAEKRAAAAAAKAKAKKPTKRPAAKARTPAPARKRPASGRSGGSARKTSKGSAGRKDKPGTRKGGKSGRRSR